MPENFRIAVIADLDKKSKLKTGDGKEAWHSVYMTVRVGVGEERAALAHGGREGKRAGRFAAWHQPRHPQLPAGASLWPPALACPVTPPSNVPFLCSFSSRVCPPLPCRAR
jgi:hypothetical protein